MKKAFYLVLVLFFAFVSCNDDDNDITVGYTDLPSAAQTFLETHFSGVQISYILKERDGSKIEYLVSFVTGGYVEFERNGTWEKVSCYNTGVPDSVIPTKILDYFKTNYPSNKIVEIEQTNTRYSVDLNNGFEFLFDKSGNLIEIDYN